MSEQGRIKASAGPGAVSKCGPLTDIYNQLTGYHQLLFGAFWLHPAVTLPRLYLQWHYERHL